MIRVKDMWILNVLNQMAGLLVDHSIDNEFYAHYMHKPIDWLAENAETIGVCFYNHVEKFEFEFNNWDNLLIEYNNDYNKKLIIEAASELQKGARI